MNHYIINQNQLTPTFWTDYNIKSGDTIYVSLGEVEHAVFLPSMPAGLTGLHINCAGTVLKLRQPKPKRIKHHPLTDFFKT